MGVNRLSSVDDKEWQAKLDKWAKESLKSELFTWDLQVRPMIDIPSLVEGHIHTFDQRSLYKWFRIDNKKSHPNRWIRENDKLDNYTLLDEDIDNILHSGIEDKKERLRKRVPLLIKLDDDQIEKVMNRLSSIMKLLRKLEDDEQIEIVKTAISQGVDIPNYSDLDKMEEQRKYVGSQLMMSY